MAEKGLLRHRSSLELFLEQETTSAIFTTGLSPTWSTTVGNLLSQVSSQSLTQLHSTSLPTFLSLPLLLLATPNDHGLSILNNILVESVALSTDYLATMYPLVDTRSMRFASPR